MKFTGMIRMQAVLMGLGAALFFANAAYAQQEVDPTTFEPNPGLTETQGAPVAQFSIPDVASPAAVVASTLGAADAESLAVQEADVKEWTPVDTLALMATILVLAFIVTSGIAEAARERHSRIPA
jgi:hypothetical protein